MNAIRPYKVYWIRQTETHNSRNIWKVEAYSAEDAITQVLVVVNQQDPPAKVVKVEPFVEEKE